MIDVTVENFEAEVVAASMNVPVLVDFWAPWCGPCKSLGPVLEKLETEYAGRFKLAKLNSDDQPEIAGQLSQAFGVRSIPFCVLFKDGQPVDGFVGAIPEAQIREFLDRHVPSPEELEAEEETAEAEALEAEGDLDAAVAKLQQAVAVDPANDTARCDYVKLLIETGRIAQARTAWEPVASKAMLDGRADLYAIGVMLYQMLTGEIPFREETQMATAFARLKRDPADPGTLVELPPAGEVAEEPRPRLAKACHNAARFAPPLSTRSACRIASRSRQATGWPP